MAIATDKFYAGDSATNTVEEIVTIGHTSTGTPAAGLGAALGLAAENNNSEVVSAAQIIGYLSSVTDGAEYGEALLRIIYNGTLKTIAKFTGLSTGSVVFYDTPMVLDTTVAGTGACWFICGPAGTNRHWGRMFTGNNLTTGKRWDFYANDTAESGSNAGTDVRLGAYDDSGAWIDDPIQIVRAAGGAFTTPRPLKVAEDTDTTIILGRARFDSRVSDVAYFSHYDQTATTAYALKQNSSGNTVVNCIGIGTLANSGTNSVQWSNGRLVGGPALGTLNVRFAGVLNTNITAVGNVGAGVDDLMSYTIPAAQLPTDKDTLNFELVFKTAANANNKQIKVLYGATTLYDSGVVAADDDQLVVRGRIIRTGATTQIAHVTAVGNSGGAFSNTATLTTPAETLSGTVVLKSTGEATSDNDIQQIYQTIIWEPAT